MDFLRELLGREEMIFYRKPVRVWRLVGTATIYVDERWRPYLRYWEAEGEAGKTPGQRSRKIWGKKERRFRRFSRGITSLGRGLYLAKLRAGRQSIPTLEKILNFFDQEVRGRVIDKSFFSWESLAPTFKKKILQTGFLFEKAKKPELQESFHKIYCLIRGADGRINVGAFLAVTTAISDRLRERLNSIYAWVAVFSGQEQALLVIQQRFEQLLEELEKKIKLWRRHEAFARGRTTSLQQKLLPDKIISAARGLKPFAVLKPFDRWAWLTHYDLEKAAEAVKKGNYPLARLILERIKVALAIKWQQKKLDSLLLRIGEDQVLKQWRPDFYQYELGSFIKFFESYVGKEAEVGFQEPVCKAVVNYLSQAKERIRLKNLPKLVGPIKEAYQLL